MEDKTIEQEGQQTRIHLFARDSWAPGKFFICSCLFFILFIFIIVLAIPIFFEIYENQEIKPCLWTCILIELNRIFGLDPVLSYFCGLTFLFIALWMDHEQRLKPTSRLWPWAWLTTLITIIVFVIFSVLFIFMPFSPVIFR